MTALGNSKIHERARQVFAAVAHHVAERAERRLHAQPEERQAAFQQDRLGKGDGHGDDQGRGDVGQDMDAVDPPARGAELADGAGIALLVGGDGEAARDAGVAFPAVQPHQADEQHQRVAEEGEHRQGHDQEGHAGVEVDQHQDQPFDPPAEMGGDEAQRRAQGGGDQGAEEGDQQADADRHDQARKHVAAELVGAQRMAPAAAERDRRQQPRPQIEGGEVIGRQPVGAQRHHQHQRDPGERRQGERRPGFEEARAAAALDRRRGRGRGRRHRGAVRMRGSIQP